jgi:hypothetical protein
MTAVIQEHHEQIDQEECPWEDIETLTANGISAVKFFISLAQSFSYF